jgi:hypothetical protein
MHKQVIWFCGAAIAAIVAGSMSLPVVSVAQAQPRAEAPFLSQHRAGYDDEHYWSEPNRPTRNPAAYHGYFTSPEFDPQYHGSNGG